MAVKILATEIIFVNIANLVLTVVFLVARQENFKTKQHNRSNENDYRNESNGRCDVLTNKSSINKSR